MIHDLLIVGGGPAGLSASIYASRASLAVITVEGFPPGGQLTQTTEVENYPGFPDGVLGMDLVSNMRKQAGRFGTKFITDNVLSIGKTDNIFTTILTNGDTLMSKTVLVATGANAKWLGLEGEKRFIGRGVSGCATCDGFFFKGKTVVVVGGGDTAMEEASFLTKFASKVYIVHRRDSFRASKIMQDRVLNNPKIEVIWNSTVKEIIGDARLTSLIVEKTDGSVSTLNTDGLFVAIGHKPSTDFLFDTGIEFNSEGYIITSEIARLNNLPTVKDYSIDYRYMTKVGGVFAAGDCVDSIYRQAATAVGMAVAAELEIEKYLDTIDHPTG